MAIQFPETVGNMLFRQIQLLREAAQQGNFTRKENLHLTLAFLGETEQLVAAKEAIHQVNFQSFSAFIFGLGKFPRSGGDILWAGMKENQKLEILQSDLYQSLDRCGFKMEARPFRPHLTLGREVVLKEAFSQKLCPDLQIPAEFPVKEIVLMKSERILGKLTYTAVDRQRLI